MNLKLLITSIIDLEISAPNRLHHIIRQLLKKHEVTVISINDSWKVKTEGNKYSNNFKDIIDKIEILHLTEGNISPLMQEFFSPIFLKKFNLSDFDLILNYNTLITGYYASKYAKKPMILDIADDLPEMIGESPQVPFIIRPIAKKLGTYFLNKNIKNAKEIILISESLKKTYSISDEKTHIIPNGVDSELFQRVVNNKKCELNLENRFVIGYVGALREWINLRPVFEAMKRFDDISLLIVGGESELERNIQMAKMYGIDKRVIFTGTVPYFQVPEYMMAMDVCLIPFEKNMISQNSVPLKLFEYLACEKIVISSRIKNVIDIAGDMIFYADNSKEMVDCINQIRMLDMDNQLGKKGRKFIIDNYRWVNLLKEYSEVINHMKTEE